MTAQVSDTVAATEPRGTLIPAKPKYGLPFWILAAYFFVEYVRPQDRIPGIGALKIGLIFTALSAMMWFARGDKAVLREPVIRAYIALVALVAISVPLAVNTYWAYKSSEVLTLFLLAAILPATTILTEPQRLRKFFQLWIVFHVLVTLSALQTGGRGSGSFLIDENDLALALGMAIPYAFFLSQSPTNKLWVKLFYLFGAGALVLGVIMTASRGGFVGLVGCLVIILLLAKHKVRNLMLVFLIALGVWAWVPSSYYAEIESISDPTDSTRQDRLYMWERAWEMYLDHPMIGVGAGNFPWRIYEYQTRMPDFDPDRTRLRGGRVAHSLYFTLISELGSIGTLLFAAMLFVVTRKLFRVMKAKSDDPAMQPTLAELSLLAKAMIASLGTFLFSGLFISVLYYPHFWYLIGFALALSYCADRLVRGPKTATTVCPAGGPATA